MKLLSPLLKTSTLFGSLGTAMHSVPVLMEGLINNLLSTAICHTTKAGSITTEGTKTPLGVRNKGEPLQSNILEKSFNDFIGNQARSEAAALVCPL